MALALSACAAGNPGSAPMTANLAPDVGRLSMNAASLRPAPLKTHRFDPSDGLDPTEIAVLAVLNSPDLAARRASAGIAAAQAFAAGLLPDPQLALSVDFPLHPLSGVTTTAYNINPSLDLLALVTHSTALKSARASGRQADLDLLWAEWTTAQQARQLAVTILIGEAKIALLDSIARGLDDRVARADDAVARGDSTLPAAGGDLAARLDARNQLATARREAGKARGDLNALIGLSPDARLDLVPDPSPVALNDVAMGEALTSLPRRRPDLLALQAGREAQDANVHKSILSRFPLINLGFSHQEDNSGIVSNGPGATLVIPIFNRGRGDLAIQTATRESLAAEYQARLDQTVADVAAARRDRDLARDALARLRAQTPALVAAADRARDAERRRDIDSAAFLALDEAALRAQIAVLDQQLALALANISLETVLFLPSDASASS